MRLRRTTRESSRTAPLPWRVWSRRAALLADALGRPGSSVEVTDVDTLQQVLNSVLDARDRQHVWLALAVLSGRLPDEDTVIEAARGSEFDEGRSLVDAVLAATTTQSATWTVRIAASDVVVDVAHTTSTALTTGIQRVARETTRRWHATHGCVLVSWTENFQSLRELDAVEHQRVVQGAAATEPVSHGAPTVVVPWHSTYVLPELAAEPERSSRLRALARFGTNTTGVIGFDCVPITSAETTQLGFSAVFAGNLSAVRYFDRVATISGAARTEYAGWRSTLSAIGIDGPDIRAIALPVEVGESTEAESAAARARFMVGSLPLVLVVGSHEPRKNHLAILYAAEALWREGREFSLSFVGGNSWGSEDFRAELAAAQRSGRPVDSESGVADGVLWAAYRLARFTVFPSFNEGFGLPVAESLAVGTPAITSNFGSMLEIAEGGGALVVDPHDDATLVEAMRLLLAGDVALDRLRAEAEARAERTWSQYAEETWAYLVPAPVGAGTSTAQG